MHTSHNSHVWRKETLNIYYKTNQTRSCQHHWQFINPQGFIIHLAQNLNLKLIYSVLLQTVFDHLMHFSSSVAHWLRPNTDVSLVAAVQELTNRNSVPEVVGMLSTSSAPTMSWMWYFMWNFTCAVVRRSSSSAFKTSLYLDFFTMPSTALRPCIKYLVNLPELGMESHQLPASLTVRTPDLTSCLHGGKILCADLWKVWGFKK